MEDYTKVLVGMSNRITQLERAASRGLAFRPVTTAGRPTAVSAGVGAALYDTTLSKPIWSNGTVWKDAAGTTV